VKISKIVKCKLLSIIVFVESLFLLMTTTLTINLYFNYLDTKEMIENTISACMNIYSKMLDAILIMLPTYINDITIQVTGVFSNRELAIGFWIIVLIVYGGSLKPVRKHIPGLIKAMFDRKLMYWYLSMLIYLIGMIVILKAIGFWEARQFKDTIIWFLFVGIISSSRAVGKAKDLNYFFIFIKDNIKLMILVEFIINLYSFSFLSELFLVFFAVLLSMMVVVIENSPKYQNKNGKVMKNSFNFLLTIIGFLVLINSIRLTVINIDSIVISELIKDLLLPSILSIFFVIYIYLFVIYAAYEIVFVRLKFIKTIDDRFRFLLKLRILLFCNINIIRINSFIQRSLIKNCDVKSKVDIGKLFGNYKSYKPNKNIQDGSNFS